MRGHRGRGRGRTRDNESLVYVKKELINIHHIAVYAYAENGFHRMRGKCLYKIIFSVLIARWYII